ncbi:sensor histidine kinase [Brevibacterium senegalense]|uniref:sensor histidine kinase n=1 Tax=Brevibacterium senegalense TaxID=1033736 RepID=UPI00037B1A6C|nr:HAMP domain-containing sensor histidine kinase [Brevibacterium senegalense]
MGAEGGRTDERQSAATAPDAASASAGVPGARTVRGRVLAMMLAFMLLGLAAAGTVSYTSQFAALEARVDTELRQEIDELELVAQLSLERQEGGLEDLLRSATGAVVPGEYESVIALLDGQPLFQPEDVNFSLSDPEVLAQINDRSVPGRTVYTDITIDGAPHRAAIASVTVAGDDRQGTFAAVNRVAAQRESIWRSAGIYAATSLGVLLLAAIAGQLVSGRLMRPLEELRDATRSISPDDLDRRVTVPDGDDDVAALARTFNTMLDRISDGFAEQRRFMSDVSHELRTPLTIIRGTLETTDSTDPADVEEGHQISLEEIERMDQLVGDLSTLAKAGRPDFLRLAPVDLELFGPRVLSRMEHLGDREWILDSHATGFVLADDARLIQAIVQLAANAIRFTDPGSRIRLRIEVVGRRFEPDRPQESPRSLIIAVRDDGTGIPAGQQEAIFDRFVRLGAGDPSAGSGLGLSIVRAIAEGHGGRAHVDSREGVGSEFVLTLPYRPVPPVPAMPPPGAAVAPSSAARPPTDPARPPSSTTGTPTTTAGPPSFPRPPQLPHPPKPPSPPRRTS